MFALKMIVTYKCNSMCDHCRFRSGPDLKGVIPTQKAKQWVKALREHFNLERLVLYGGEPTLYFDEMHDIANYAHSIGVAINIETNCSWAVTLESAKKFLNKMVDLDPQYLFSFDGFHARYIPFERVKNAVNAARAMGIPYSHDIALMDNVDAENDYDKLTKHLIDEMKAEVNPSEYYPFRTFYTGRSAEKLAAKFTGIPGESPDFYQTFLPNFRRWDQTCIKLPWYLDISHENTNVIDVDPYGWVSFGCGIAIGNANEHAIEEIVQNYNPGNHPVISVLMKEGPFGLTKIPEAQGYVMKKTYVDKCHLCQDIRNYIRPSFPDMLVPPHMYF